MVQNASTFFAEFISAEISSARTLPRALCAKKHRSSIEKCSKFAFFHVLGFSSARSARGLARAPNFFPDLNSSNPEDDFCTLNESKKVKIDN